MENTVIITIIITAAIMYFIFIFLIPHLKTVNRLFSNYILLFFLELIL